VIEVNKEVKQFRGKPLQYREQLNEIFNGTAADGRFAQDSDFPINLEYRDEPSTNISPPRLIHDSAKSIEDIEIADVINEEEEVSINENEKDPFQSIPLTIR
jgi:hypothetical protein